MYCFTALMIVYWPLSELKMSSFGPRRRCPSIIALSSALCWRPC